MKEDLIKNIQSVFEYNKEAKEIFVTSDNQVFLNENLAKSHSVRINGQKRDKTLEYKKVGRSDFEKMRTNKDETSDEIKSNETKSKTNFKKRK